MPRPVLVTVVPDRYCCREFFEDTVMAQSSDIGSLEQAILDYVNQPEYKPARPQSLSRKLGVRKKHREKFELLLDKLHSEGRLRISESGRIQANAPAGLIAGVMRKRSSGAGFVIPHPPLTGGITGDLYVHPEDMHDAHNGDEVLVRLRKRRGPGGRRCAVVAEVVERATNVFVGEYFEEGEQGYVEIDGTNFTEPVWVGDPGAKGAQEGDQVVIEMIRFPTQHTQGEAVLTQVLGPRGEPGVDTLTVIHEFGLRDEFPEDVLDAARIEAENFDENDLTDREDLTGELMVTIDPVDARDFDDAISLTRSEDGHWHLGVHIADVAHFVQPGTPLDREAQLRGTSVYLPTKVIPMLPEVLSNSLASLQEKRVRFAKSVFIEYTAEGIPVHTRFARSAIKVNKRFAYEQVLPIIEGDGPQRGDVPAKIRKLLTEMHELAMLLRGRRFSAGAMNLDLPEIKLEFDNEGRVSGAHETVHDESHQLIEEFMLAANIAVATELTDRGIEFLRRTHGEPSEKKMQAFAEFAKVLGYKIKNPQSKPELQRLLEQAKGTPEERAIHYGLLRSFKQAVYSPLDTGHYALAVQNYCHFTSPIRRYPDLTIHRWIDALLLENKTYRGPSGEELMRLGRQCSTNERRAADAERELTNIKLLAYLETRIDSEWDAVITGVDRYGFFARGIELPAEGLVHVSTLSNIDYYEYDRDAHSLVGRRTGERFRLGDRVRVRVAHVDVGRRQLDFRLVRHETSRRPKKKNNSRKKGAAPARSQAMRTKPKKKGSNQKRKSPKGRK
ncbi:MAG: ribonuclease R [Planctomycetota bacterium]|nr:MAG: ribonuclease R [Planctomycetota bacterium]